MTRTTAGNSKLRRRENYSRTHGGDIRLLQPDGRSRTLWSPLADSTTTGHSPETCYAASLEEAVTDAEVVALITEWAIFREADPVRLGQLVARRNIVDGRHALDPSAYRAAGWDYRALGVLSRELLAFLPVTMPGVAHDTASVQ